MMDGVDGFQDSDAGRSDLEIYAKPQSCRRTILDEVKGFEEQRL